MKFLCRAYTGGGPVAIMRRSDVYAWNGDEHYFAACDTGRGRHAQIIHITDFQYPVIVLHQQNENFHVFYDETAFAVVSIDSVEPGHEMRVKRLSFATAKRLSDLGKLSDFGGRVVIFDAAIPGQRITLQEVGGEATTVADELPGDFYDTALVDVSEGDWHVSVINYKDAFLG